MIRINLLPARKAKRVAEPGQGQIVAGVGALAAAAAVVFLVVHRPMQTEHKALTAANEELQTDVNAKARSLSDFEVLKKVVASVEARSTAIDRLIKSKAVPAHLLHEIGEILTPGRLPTMTRAMADAINPGPNGDPNKRIALDWDPKHVWITTFEETKGEFKVIGGAQSDSDVTQLSKRMQASVYFEDVTPQGGEKETDAASGVSFFKFTITGKVVY